MHTVLRVTWNNSSLQNENMVRPNFPSKESLPLWCVSLSRDKIHCNYQRWLPQGMYCNVLRILYYSRRPCTLISIY